MLKTMYPKDKRSGLILAAGLGMRLKTLNSKNSNIKPLIDVGGQANLLMRTIHSHEKAGCENVFIILGYEAQKIKNYIMANYFGPLNIQFLHNKKYYLKNGISVLCAKEHVTDDFILTMADHILDDRIMEMVKFVKPPPNGASLCVDYKIETIFDLEDATKVLARNNKIVHIGKNLKLYNCIDTGVFICTKALMDALENIYLSAGDVSLSQGVQVLADNNRMAAIDIGDCYWQDVDTPEMLAHAEFLLKSLKNKKAALFQNKCKLPRHGSKSL